MTDILNLKVNGQWVGIPVVKGDTGAQGRQGDKGERGEGVAPGGTPGQVLVKSSNEDYGTEWKTTSFVYNQAIASDTWVIEHNLNKEPSITVTDSAGTRITGFQADYNNLNTVTITFNGGFTGKAVLN